MTRMHLRPANLELDAREHEFLRELARLESGHDVRASDRWWRPADVGARSRTVDARILLQLADRGLVLRRVHQGVVGGRKTNEYRIAEPGQRALLLADQEEVTNAPEPAVGRSQPDVVDYIPTV